MLRAEIVWDKPNPIPESATDRVHRTHEQWFHLTMAPRYYSALDVLRVPIAAPGRVAGASAFGARNASLKRTRTGAYRGPNPLGALPGSVWKIAAEPFVPPDHIDIDHHAAFPTEWPRRFVLGASPPGICVACGEGRRPVTERDTVFDKARDQAHASEIAARGAAHAVMSGGTARSTLNGRTTHSITGWSCACTPYTDHEGTGEPSPTAGPDGRQGERPGDIGARHRRVGPWREYHLDGWEPPRTTPAVVLDPFGGTGTVALVASALGRVGVAVDLSADYCGLARWRTTDRRQIAAALRVPRPPEEHRDQGALFEA